MPLKWFRRSSTCENEAIEKKNNTKWNTGMTKRTYRSNSQGSGLRQIIGLGCVEREATAAIAAQEEQRRLAKSRRRFTVHGTSTHQKQMEAKRSGFSTPAGSPHPMFLSTSPNYPTNTMKHYGMTSTRVPHGRSPPLQVMNSPGPDFHPSIIFIDCPP